MSTLTIYDPPQCCSTGVCGADVDQRLVDFAADLDWLQSQGIEVRRINLSAEPMAFVENAAIKALIDTAGTDALPAILVSGAVISTARYPTRGDLAKWAGLGEASEAAGPSAGPSTGPSAGPSAAEEGCCGGSTKGQNAAPATSGCCGGSTGDASEEAEAAGGCC